MPLPICEEYAESAIRGHVIEQAETFQVAQLGASRRLSFELINHAVPDWDQLHQVIPEALIAPSVKILN